MNTTATTPNLTDVLAVLATPTGDRLKAHVLYHLLGVPKFNDMGPLEGAAAGARMATPAAAVKATQTVERANALRAAITEDHKPMVEDPTPYMRTPRMPRDTADKPSTQVKPWPAGVNYEKGVELPPAPVTLKERAQTPAPVIKEDLTPAPTPATPKPTRLVSINEAASILGKSMPSVHRMVVTVHGLAPKLARGQGRPAALYDLAEVEALWKK